MIVDSLYWQFLLLLPDFLLCEKMMKKRSSEKNLVHDYFDLLQLLLLSLPSMTTTMYALIHREDRASPSSSASGSTNLVKGVHHDDHHHDEYGGTGSDLGGNCHHSVSFLLMNL